MDIIVELVSNKEYLTNYINYCKKNDAANLFRLETRKDMFKNTSKFDYPKTFLNSIEPLKLNIKNDIRMIIFLYRWFEIQRICKEINDNNNVTYIRSDLYATLPNLETLASLSSKYQFIVSRKYKIKSIKLPILKRFFLKDHMFDGLVVSKAKSLRLVYSKILQQMLQIKTNFKGSKELLILKKTLNDISLNTPSIQFYGYYPEQILKMSFGARLYQHDCKDMIWSPYKPLGLKDKIFRVH
tara:strand:- start:19993 stop:20715 length:723 start_codon:yes stop_codon:yes gene_type:complete